MSPMIRRDSDSSHSDGGGSATTPQNEAPGGSGRNGGGGGTSAQHASPGQPPLPPPGFQPPIAFNPAAQIFVRQSGGAGGGSSNSGSGNRASSGENGNGKSRMKRSGGGRGDDDRRSSDPATSNSAWSRRLAKDSGSHRFVRPNRSSLLIFLYRQVAGLDRFGLLWGLRQRGNPSRLPAGVDARSVRDVELVLSLVNFGLAAVDDPGLTLYANANALSALTLAAPTSAATSAASQQPSQHKQQQQQWRKRHKSDARRCPRCRRPVLVWLGLVWTDGWTGGASRSGEPELWLERRHLGWQWRLGRKRQRRGLHLEFERPVIQRPVTDLARSHLVLRLLGQRLLDPVEPSFASAVQLGSVGLGLAGDLSVCGPPFTRGAHHRHAWRRR